MFFLFSGHFPEKEGRNSNGDQAGIYQNKMRRFGTNAYRYECDICGKVIANIGNLNRHRRLHTGEKPYTCGSCFKKFSDGGNFLKHLRIHGHVKL